jgi:hypothetical protein
MGFDQLLPVYLQYPPLGSRTDATAISILTSNNPLKFAGGLGLDHFRIGLITTVYGICGMVIQFTVFPPFARRFGVLNCLKACAIAFPIANFLIPFTALLPTLESQIAGCFGVLFIKCWASIFAFPCSTILLTNSATSLRVLGTLNGFATSFSAVGRALGPFMGGWLFSAGVEAGYVITPWWTYAAVGVIGAIPIWFLIEGEGFGGDDDQVSDEEEFDEEEEDRLRAQALEGEAEAAGRLGPELFPARSREQVEEREEEEYGGFGPLTRTTTMSSAMTLGSDIGSTGGPSRRASEVDGGPSRADGPSDRTSLSRRGSRRVMRRTSIPFGMGQAVSRRYSSNLGQSLGTSGSFNAPG